MTNPITIIKKDHRKVEALFKEYKGLGDTAFKTKQDIAMEIIGLLTVHAEMEEVIFYPRLEEVFNKEGDKIVEEGIAEHGVAKTLMFEIERLSPEDPQFEAKMEVLRESVSHHVKEEEEEMLPKAEKEVNEDDMNELGEKMLAFKKEKGMDTE